MHHDSTKQEFKPVTSLELADHIDALIKVRILQAGGDKAEAARPADMAGVNLEDLAELALRRMADAFKRLDHNPGVAVFSKDEYERLKNA